MTTYNATDDRRNACEPNADRYIGPAEPTKRAITPAELQAWMNGMDLPETTIRPQYTFDAQATADALAILQRASAACTHCEPVYRMTHSARALLNAEMAEYFRGL